MSVDQPSNLPASVRQRLLNIAYSPIEVLPKIKMAKAPIVIANGFDWFCDAHRQMGKTVCFPIKAARSDLGFPLNYEEV